VPKILRKTAGDLELGKGLAGKGITVVVDGEPLSEEEARHREMALKHEYHFDRDFPREYKKAKELIVRHNSDISDDELRFRLGEIVYLHRKRRMDPDYKNRMEESISSAEAAADLADKILEDIMKADYEYRNVVVSIARYLFQEEKVVGELAGLTGQKGQELALLMFAGQVFRSFHLSLKLGSMYISELPSPTRPKTPYTLEAFKLIELWSFLTGEPAVSPKGRAKGKDGEYESPQESTEFVRLSMTMIDPNSTLSQVQTSIKRAITQKEAYRRILLGGETKLPGELLELMRRLAK
jgi:hypothetical protein